MCVCVFVCRKVCLLFLHVVFLCVVSLSFRQFCWCLCLLACLLACMWNLFCVCLCVAWFVWLFLLFCLFACSLACALICVCVFVSFVVFVLPSQITGCDVCNLCGCFVSSFVVFALVYVGYMFSCCSRVRFVQVIALLACLHVFLVASKPGAAAEAGLCWSGAGGPRWHHCAKIRAIQSLCQLVALINHAAASRSAFRLQQQRPVLQQAGCVEGSCDFIVKQV